MQPWPWHLNQNHFRSSPVACWRCKTQSYWGNGFCRHCGQIGKPREERPKGKGGKGKSKAKFKSKQKAADDDDDDEESASEVLAPPPKRQKAHDVEDLTGLDDGEAKGNEKEDEKPTDAKQEEEPPAAENINHRPQRRRRRFWNKPN